MTAVLAGVLVLVAAGSVRAASGGWRRRPVAGRVRGLAPAGAAACSPGWSGVAAALRPPAWVAGRLTDAGAGLDPGAVWAAGLAGAVCSVVAALVVGGPGAGALVAAGWLVAPEVAWRLLRHRGSARLEAALPAAVEAVAAGLRSGASLRQALAEAAVATPGPLGDDLGAVSTATHRGGGLVAALEAWATRRDLPGVRLVVAALCLGVETGGTTARAVDGVAVTLRQRLAAQAEAGALATQARVSAAVIAVAPVAFAALAAATDPRSAAFLLRTPAGLGLLAAGLALDAAGALWMARLTRIEP